jgi:hypothetical protein
VKDRAEFYPGPARRDIEKVAERVQDNLDTKTTASTEASFEVTGSYTVVGLPPGIPFVYVNSLLTQSPLATANSFGYTTSIPDSVNDTQRHLRYAIQDTTNAFDRGTAAMVGRDSVGFVVFNPASGTIGRVSPPAGLMASVFGLNPWQSNKMLVDSRFAASPTAYYVENGTIGSIALEVPPNATAQVRGIGPAADGVNICSVWSGSTSVLAIHSPDGTLLGSRLLTGDTNSSDSKVQNGYVLSWRVGQSAGSTHTFFVTPAALTGPLFTSNVNVSTVGVPPFRSNITPDGYVFWESSSDLFRLNCATGLLEVFPNTFDFDPSFGFTRIFPISMSARSASQVGYLGYLNQTVDGVTYYRWAWVPIAIANSVVTSSPVVSGDAYTGNSPAQALGAAGPVLVRASGSATFQVAGQLWTVAYP